MKRLLALAMMTGIIAITPLASSAAPLPAGTTLTLTQGLGGNTTSTSLPGTGSKFGMDVFGDGNLLWTDVNPGTQGGIVIGTTQSDGGQMSGPSASNSTPGQIDAAWYFFNAYGTVFTYATVLQPSGATANFFDSASCGGTTGISCVGLTALGAWGVSWNGTNPPDGVPLGEGIVNAWTVSGNRYTLDYRQTTTMACPDLCSEPYSLHLEGNIMFPGFPTAIPSPIPTPIRPASNNDSGSAAGSGGCGRIDTTSSDRPGPPGSAVAFLASLLLPAVWRLARRGRRLFASPYFYRQDRLGG